MEEKICPFMSKGQEDGVFLNKVLCFREHCMAWIVVPEFTECYCDPRLQKTSEIKKPKREYCRLIEFNR